VKPVIKKDTYGLEYYYMNSPAERSNYSLVGNLNNRGFTIELIINASIGRILAKLQKTFAGWQVMYKCDESSLPVLTYISDYSQDFINRVNRVTNSGGVRLIF
jgi:hypothetical protein